MSDERPYSERPAARPASPTPPSPPPARRAGSTVSSAKPTRSDLAGGSITGGVLLAATLVIGLIFFLVATFTPDPKPPTNANLSIQPAAEVSDECDWAIRGGYQLQRDAYEDEGKLLDVVNADGAVSGGEQSELNALYRVTEEVITRTSVRSLTECRDAADWFAGVLATPGFVGLTGASFVDDLSLEVLCGRFGSTPVCRDAKQEGLKF